MGSPVSPLCADIFMNEIENQVLNHKVCRKHICYWYRYYVDNILCLWNGPKEDLDWFLSHMKSINSQIQFTMEIGESTINFLDLTITLVDNKHNFKIYRKDTFCDNIIPANSNHPVTHKHAALHTMIHRLVSLPLNKDDFQYELSVIRTIAYNNGYEPKLVDKLLQKKQQKIATRAIYSGIAEKTPNNTKYVRIPFLGKKSYKFSRLLKPECQPVFYTKRSLKSLLFNNKDIISADTRSGVYRLECGVCEATYIGQTGRKFSTRLKEHARVWHTGKGESAFGEHLHTENHTFDPGSNFFMLHFCDKGRKLDALEALEINKRRNNPLLLNEKTDLNNSPLLNININ